MENVGNEGVPTTAKQASSDETPFPKGITVFDDADEDEDGQEDGASPSSNDDELENGYEVICAREIVQIPTQGANANQS